MDRLLLNQIYLYVSGIVIRDLARLVLLSRFIWNFLFLTRSKFEGPKPATRGEWMRADQNFFEIWTVGLYSEKSPKPSNVLAKVWNSYGKAKRTQKASNEWAKPRSKSEANWENCRTDLSGPVWPVHWTGLTGHACSNTSRPVWPVLPTGLTGGTQKTPEIQPSNHESRANCVQIRWNSEESFVPTPRTYPQEISS